MGERKSEKEFEEKRLEETIALAEEQLQQAKAAAAKKRLEIIEAKKDVRENTAHSITNLWDSDNFEALAELSQYANPVTDKIVDYEEEENKIFLLERLRKSPYFARIDFRFDGEDEFEKIYIGRSPLKKGRHQERYVYDWRSPIASVFYRFMTGEAFYDAPCGRVTGEVNLKRQYEIKDGALEYFFDADVQIVDEFLRQLLSQNTSAKMKAIVETIQKEQDIVIRDMENDLLMVQGAAGSGKTSIALHRAAYLMYQGLQSKLSADHIIIISPNSVFEQYIANVLPELGEDQVVSFVFDDMISAVLRSDNIQSKNEFLEKLIGDSRHKAVTKSSIEFKTSNCFLKILDQFLYDIPHRWTGFDDIFYKGKCVISKEKFIKPDVIGLYQKLFDDKEYFYSLLPDDESVESIEEIWNYTQKNLESGCLHYDDAIAATYLYLKIYGFNEYKNIKQVVIDEAQDYYPLQYVIFYMLFPNAKFTILGDMNQTLAKQEDLSLYEQIRKIMKKKKSSLITLDKSFRCTTEILNYSLNFMVHNPEIKSFNRKGDAPGAAVFDSQEALVDKICEEVELCQKKEFQSIGLICKTERNSIQLFEKLKDKMDVQIIKSGEVSDLRGVFVIPIYMSKGLEFDAVIICDADNCNYIDEDDRNLLYVGCTRALHRLNLFCEGKLSPLIHQ